jgi:hypothetical protein
LFLLCSKKGAADGVLFHGMRAGYVIVNVFVKIALCTAAGRESDLPRAWQEKTLPYCSIAGANTRAR